MSYVVVDTNVPVVASGRSEHAGPDCVVACINALAEVYQQGIVILDDTGLILHEYMTNLSMSGQPGAGDFFMKWIWSVQADERYCRLVHITLAPDVSENFAEFPIDARLVKFDPHDRKFVAVALISGYEPKILNAVDSDWANHFVALSENGLHISFLCPQHVCPV